MPRVPVPPEDVNTPQEVDHRGVLLENVGTDLDPDYDPATDPYSMDEGDEPAAPLSSTNGTGHHAEPAPEPMSTLEILLDEMVEESDAWGYVNAILDRDTPTAGRHAFYGRWIAMVAERSVSERDMLIARGRQVFTGITAETMRHDIGELVQTGATTKTAPYVEVDQEAFAEMIHVPSGAPSIRYLIYKNDGAHTIEDNVNVGSILYRPPQTVYADVGTLLLPTGIEEYGTDQDLWQAVSDYLDRSVVIVSPDWRDVAVAYVFMTWVFEKFPSVPYLRALGDWGSGKTTLMEVIAHVCCRSIMMSGATTTSPIFRAIDKYRGTWFYDEADIPKSRDEMHGEIIKILNNGYKSGIPVFRTQKISGKAGEENFDERPFQVFGPKLLTMRDNFIDSATESRCFTYTAPVLAELPSNMKLDFTEEAKAEAQHLRNRLLLWRLRHLRTLTIDDTRIPGIELRVQQTVRPLLAVTATESARTNILAVARELGLSMREMRGEAIEGRIVRVMADLWLTEEETEKKGWEVPDIVRRLNPEGTPQHLRVSKERVGLKMKALLGYRADRVGKARTYTYRFSRPHFDRLVRAYIGRLPVPGGRA